MRRRDLVLSASLALLPLLPLAGWSAPQQTTATAPINAGKKPITHDVYDTWRSLQGQTLSQNGEWVGFVVVPQNGDGELIVRNLKTDQEWRVPRGQARTSLAPTFANDDKLVLYTITPTKAEADAARKRTPPATPRNSLGILDLATGKTTVLPRVRSFRTSDDGAHRVIAYTPEPETGAPATTTPTTPGTAPGGGRRRPGAGATPGTGAGAASGAANADPKRKTPGDTLVLRDLETGTETRIESVASYDWNKDGSRLIYVVSDPKKTDGDGVYVRAVPGEKTTALLTGPGNYKSVTLDEKGERLAFLSDRDDWKSDRPLYSLFLAKTDGDKADAVVTPTTAGLPAEMKISDFGTIRFSRDGARLFFGVATPPKPEPKDAPTPINVDIWTTKDAELQPMQKLRVEQVRRRTFTTLYDINRKKVVALATPDLPTITVGDGIGEFALGLSDLPYRQLSSWEDSFYDYFLVSLSDGKRIPVLTKHGAPASLSPGGKYLTYWSESDNAWFVRPVAKAAVRTSERNLTGALGVRFQQEDWDTPGAPAPYGIAGWTDNDASILIYDRFDLWQINPIDGKAKRLTNGREREISYRYRNFDDENTLRTIPTTKPIYLATTNERTFATGFSKMTIADNRAPEKLLLIDKMVGTSVKAKKADRFVFTLQRFDEFPDLWTSDATFANPKKISDANPQQKQYNWGTAEMMEFRSADDVPLRAVVNKPENFDPTKKYPLMVYIYEKLSDRVNAYVTPGPGTSINVTRYVSNGYIVLRPDIVYKTGYPGESAMKCVLPAIQKLIDQGYVDPKRIAIQGHSWGAYQITYLITRTNLFRAAEAGAAVSDMISAYGGIRWGTGMSRAFQYEKTQSRIGGAPWQMPLQFIENSPIFWVDKVQTPYLTIHNDADGAVPWYQGIEFFIAMRRLGKEAYLFNYNGEDHNLTNRENMKHWTVHMAEFFDYYLLNKPRPEWMDQGVPYLDRGKRDLSPFYGKADEDPIEESSE